ncbi:MAG: DUF554 domain-containing protein [Spirochaetes bacterium]|nr:DUF554 domain-containing protein [Spirochaetota bacterium]
MIATLINSLTVIIGSMFGLFFHKRISESYKKTVFTATGLIAVVLGLKMSFEGTKIIYLTFSLILGGILGEWWDIEGWILKFGNFLRNTFAKKESDKDFAYGFLDASVIFCVGAMTLVGAFKAGAEGDYTLLLTKSIMDGFVAMMLSSALGPGVAFSAITILIYEGGLTLTSIWLKPLVNDLVLSELTGIGGILVVMVGINLLGVAELKTANFIPALILILVFVALNPYLAFLPM